MRYIVDILTSGYYTVTVHADSVEEAKSKAIDAWTEADFGELENLDCEVTDIY